MIVRLVLALTAVAAAAVVSGIAPRLLQPRWRRHGRPAPAVATSAARRVLTIGIEGRKKGAS